jgi:hypothetical protein
MTALLKGEPLASNRPRTGQAASLLGRLAYSDARHRFGQVPEQFAVIAAAKPVMCSTMVDRIGLPTEEVEQLPRWRTSDLHDDLERLVLEYAEMVAALGPKRTTTRRSKVLDD